MSNWTLLVALALELGGCGETTSNSGPMGSEGDAAANAATAATSVSDSVGGAPSTTGAGASGLGGGGMASSDSGSGGSVNDAGGVGGDDACELPVPEPTEDETSAAILALDGLATRLAQAFCEYYSRCKYGFTAPFDKVAGGCVGCYERDFADYVAAVLLRVEAGRADGDMDAIEACLTTLSETQCEGDVDFLCSGALDGQVAPGGECRSSFDCEGEARCETTDQCPGVCESLNDPSPTGEPTQEEGMPCGGDRGECLLGLVCFYQQIYTNPGHPVITTSECVTPLEENEVCPQTNGAYPCVDDLACAEDEGGVVRCLPRRGEGEPCSTRSPRCEPELTCLPVNDDSSECSTFRYAEQGEVCGNGLLCATGTACVRVENSDRPWR
jgi:hypothetical protein